MYKFKIIPLLQPSQDRLDRNIVSAGFILIIGIFIISPILTTLFRLSPLSVPAEEFLAIAIIGLVYGICIIYFRVVFSGLVAALLVFLTVRINYPLGGTNAFVGAVGPHFWIIYVPLVGLCIYWFLGSQRPSLHLPHLILVTFAVWSVFSAVFGSGPRTDIAFYFSLWVFVISLVFICLSWLVEEGFLNFETGLRVLIVATAGNVMIAFLQFLNKGPLGFLQHGEAQRTASEYLILGPLGTYPIGPHVHGFSYGGPISILLTLTIPVIFAFALRSKGLSRVCYAVGGLTFLFVQVANAWDAGLGGTIVALLSFILLLGVSRWETIVSELVRSWKVVLATLPLAIASFLVLFMPTTRSGDASLPDQGYQPPSNSSNTKENGTTSAGSDVGATESGSLHSIPFFDTSNLGIRVDMAQMALDSSSKFPLFGMGGGNFPFFAADSELGGPYWLHNLYLQVLVGTGFPGLFLYLGALTSVLHSGYRLLSGSGTGEVLVIGAVSGIIGALAQFNFNPAFNQMVSMLTFWGIAGIVVGEYYNMIDGSTRSITSIISHKLSY